MNEAAEVFLGQTAKDKVVTVPAYFNDSQQQATKDASAFGGIKIKNIMINSVKYGQNKPFNFMQAIGLQCINII